VDESERMKGAFIGLRLAILTTEARGIKEENFQILISVRYMQFWNLEEF
jgi:hypothetical protein